MGQSTRDKLNEALGISGGQTIDQMLDDLNVQTEEFHKTFDTLDDNIKRECDNIDRKALELQQKDSAGILALQDMNTSLKEVESLIVQAKTVFQHIVDNITASDLIDSELVHSASAFLESLHLNIAEFISIYKQKQKFIEKIKLMIFNQEQKKELMELKHKHDLELIAAKQKEPDSVAADGTSYSFNTDEIIRSMSRNGDFSFDALEKDDDDDEKESSEAKTAE